ncbi:hypothetical protein PIB30_109787 [Stylosanthes scabra]|uniref:Uncharacterized protein n=1 Tax=Stylosanthes scabra TaxID=79078 RepID=A0ABU6X2T7_9FABA|nr:hypothetical protein [Stylosanthes scabra]
METVRGGAVPLLRRHQEEEEHNERQIQEEENQNGGTDHEEEAEYNQDFDQETPDAENVYESPQHQPHEEHETGAESWTNYEAQYEEQQQNYYEPPHSPPPQQATLEDNQISSTLATTLEGKLDQIASSVKGFNEELVTFKERHKQLADLSLKQFHKIRKEQEATSQEVKAIKETQINSAENQTLKDVARMTFQQREELKTIRQQMREWTMYSSVRECYDVWAHQQANPNLVPMPLHDLTKMVYDNLEKKKPMFIGALKTDPNPGHIDRTEPIPPKDLHLNNNQQVSFFEQFFESNK